MTASVSPSVAAHATVLLESRERWATIRDKRSGMRRIILPSDSGRVYYVAVDGSACSCRSGQVGQYCSHRHAVKESLHRDALAAWLDNPPAPDPKPAPKPATKYGALFPSCRVEPCDEDAGRSGFCLEHARCGVCRQPTMPGLTYASCEAHQMSNIYG